MKRDTDLCREIMRQVADSPSANQPVEIKIEGKSDEDIMYQLHLLRQAGLIEAIDVSSLTSGLEYMPQRLTWNGNEFLDAARDSTVWNKAKQRLAKVGGALAFDILLPACKAEIRQLTGSISRTPLASGPGVGDRSCVQASAGVCGFCDAIEVVAPPVAEMVDVLRRPAPWEVEAVGGGGPLPVGPGRV